MAFKEVIICEKGKQAQLFVSLLGLKQKKIINGKPVVFYDKDNGVAVTHQSGHLLEQVSPLFYEPKLSKKWELDCLPIIPKKNEWKLVVKNNQHAKRLFAGIQWALITMGTPNEITIAVDNDKEGELLGWEVLSHLNLISHPNISRMIYSELTVKAVKYAYEHKTPGAQWFSRYEAGLARSWSDWLMGMNITIALSVINNDYIPPFKPLNSGRVIFAISYIIALREKAINNFLEQDYYSERVVFLAKNGGYTGTVQYPEKFIDQDLNKMIKNDVAVRVHKYITGKSTGKIVSFLKRDKKTRPPIGFNRTDFGRHMIKKHNMSLEDIDTALQSLYSEKGLATYPRVEVRHLDVSMHDIMPNHIKAMSSNLMTSVHLSEKEILLYKKIFTLLDATIKSNIWKNGVKDGESHHAIITTSEVKNLSSLSKNEFLIYKELCDRLIVQFLPDYEYANTVVETDISGVICKSTGNVPLKLGFKALSKDLDEDDTPKDEIPLMSIGDVVTISSSETVKSTTKRPKHYTMDELLYDLANPNRFVVNKAVLKQVKKLQIGTGGTRENHIKELKPKGFVVYVNNSNKKKGKNIISLVPTKKLLAISGIAPDYFKYPEVSAYWEDAFDKIQLGELTLDNFMLKQEKLLKRFFLDIKAGQFKIHEAIEDDAKLCSATVGCDGFLYLKKIKGKSFSLWSCSKCKVAFMDDKGALGFKLDGSKNKKSTKGKVEHSANDKNHICPKCKSKCYLKKLPNKSFNLWVCEDCEQAYFDKNGQLGSELKKR